MYQKKIGVSSAIPSVWYPTVPMVPEMLKIVVCSWIALVAAAKPPPVIFNGSVSMVSYPNPDYYGQWGQNGRTNAPTCVNIPLTMGLCQDIGYNQMRLPNLLGHDTVSEVVMQAKYWVALLNLGCHPDTQLFLCSLFSPVCLDRPIYPCRSLCEAVKTGCESRMREYQYPWPDMVKCDKFPIDNDMCISIQTRPKSGGDCNFCNQAATYENILDNFCRADFVVKSKIKKIKRSKVTFRKGKVLKLKHGLDRRKMRRPVFTAEHMNISNCCRNFSSVGGESYLIMGKKVGKDQMIPTLLLRWQKKKSPFKMATRMFKKFDCSNPSWVISENIMKNGGIRIREGGHEEVIEAKKGQTGGRRTKKRRRRKDPKRKRPRRRRKARPTKSTSKRPSEAN